MSEITPGQGSDYRQLFALRGFRQMTATLALGRLADSAMSIVLVLFVLARFQSPGLAGIATFCLLLPGRILSPLAGAVLDRLDRRNVIVINYLLAAALVTAVSFLDHFGILSGAALCVLMVALGATSPIGDFGMRALFPAVVPRAFWDRANAVDSSTQVMAILLGPIGGGVCVGFFGPDGSLLGVALVLIAAALCGLSVKDPGQHEKPRERILASAWDGLRYVFRNPALRGLALVISLLNVSSGMLVVGIPVLIETHFHQTAQIAGIVFACFGAAGFVSVLFAGRANSEGRERSFLAFGNLVIGVGTVGIALSGSIWWVVISLLITGIGNGPCDIGLFSLRQRRTDPRYFGRAFAISMSLNSLGMPVGAVLAGAFLANGYTNSMWLYAAGLIALSVALIPVTIPGSTPHKNSD